MFEKFATYNKATKSCGNIHEAFFNYRLKYLNLQGNRVSKIPFLQVTDFSDHLKTPIEEQAEEDGKQWIS